MPTPEAPAREQITAQRLAAGRIIQGGHALYLGIGRGLARRDRSTRKPSHFFGSNRATSSKNESQNLLPEIQDEKE